MNILEIQLPSEAGQYLAKAMADPNTHKISVQPRRLPDGPAVAVKVNEKMWTMGLKTTI